MTERIAGITIPDTTVVADATDLVREVDTDLLSHHSLRVFHWGSLKAGHRGLTVDPELA